MRLQLQRLGVPAEVRSVFVRAGIAGFAGFAVLGFFTAVSPLFVGQVLREPSHLSGLVVFSLLGSSTAGQLRSARLPLRTSLLGGCLALAAGIATVGAGVAAGSLPVVVVGAAVAGLGQGASFRAGLQSVTGAAPAERRSEVSSSYFLVLYVAISIPVIGVGAGAQVFGLVPTAVVFAGLVGRARARGVREPPATLNAAAVTDLAQGRSGAGSGPFGPSRPSASAAETPG